MIGLVVSELLRARSRRLVVVAFVAVAAVIVVVTTIATMKSVRPSPDQLAQDQQRYKADVKSCMSQAMGPSGPTSPPGYPDMETYCRQAVPPPGANSGANMLTLSGLDNLQQGTAPMAAMLAVVLGATLMGADLSTGTMGTLLVWEPRRVRVFLIRAAVVAVVVFAFAVGVQAILALTFRVGVGLRGVADAPGWLGLAVGTTLRIGVIAVVWSLLAYVAASLTRTTGGGMGVMALELVAIEGFWRGNQQSIQRWTLIQNATAFVSRTPYPTSPPPEMMGGYGYLQTGGQVGMTTPNEALLTLLAYVAVVLLVGLVVFSRRDVT